MPGDMNKNDLYAEALKPGSDVSAGRFAFLRQIRLVTIVIVWALFVESGVIAYGIVKNDLPEQAPVINAVAIAAGAIAGIISLVAFGGKVGQSVAENKYAPTPDSTTGGSQ